MYLRLVDSFGVVWCFVCVCGYVVVVFGLCGLGLLCGTLSYRWWYVVKLVVCCAFWVKAALGLFM